MQDKTYLLGNAIAQVFSNKLRFSRSLTAIRGAKRKTSQQVNQNKPLNISLCASQSPNRMQDSDLIYSSAEPNPLLNISHDGAMEKKKKNEMISSTIKKRIGSFSGNLIIIFIKNSL